MGRDPVQVGERLTVVTGDAYRTTLDVVPFSDGDVQVRLGCGQSGGIAFASAGEAREMAGALLAAAMRAEEAAGGKGARAA